MGIVSEKLSALSEAYYAADGENYAETLQSIQQVHASVLRDAEGLAEFLREAPATAGGIYIPTLFWIELSRLAANKPNREAIHHLLRHFAQSDFDEQTRLLMKPLLVVYRHLEVDFELNRTKSLVLEGAHPGVKEFFDQMFSFREKNPKVSQAYIQKFAMLKNYFPNFALFNLSVQEIEAQLEALQKV